MKKFLKVLGAIFGPFKYIASRKTAGKLESLFSKKPYLIYIVAFFITAVILFLIFIFPQLIKDIHPV
jgi:H+/Cl- antiporter ClcA